VSPERRGLQLRRRRRLLRTVQSGPALRRRTWCVSLDRSALPRHHRLLPRHVRARDASGPSRVHGGLRRRGRDVRGVRGMLCRLVQRLAVHVPRPGRRVQAARRRLRERRRVLLGAVPRRALRRQLRGTTLIARDYARASSAPMARRTSTLNAIPQ
jgi:hypothetical protein